jgi:hypothetical protein
MCWKNSNNAVSPAPTFRIAPRRSFAVPVADIRGNKYDLSLNRYKEAAHEAVKFDPLQSRFLGG